MKKKKNSRNKFNSPSLGRRQNRHPISKNGGELIYQLFQAKSALHTKDLKHSGKNVLVELSEQQLLTKDSSKRHALKDKKTFYIGTLDSHPKGFGFIHDIRAKHDQNTPSQDPYVSIHQINNALHGDKVLIQVTHTAKNGRCEARIIHIVSEGKSSIAGIVSLDKKSNKSLVFPEDKRLSFVIETPYPKVKIEHGDAVIVELFRSSSPEDIRKGKITEILGNPDSVANQIRFVVEKFDLPRDFSKKSLAELEYLEESDSDREDLRHICHVTIDGSTAKDFDDAIFVEQKDEIFRLYVSIADVSHYVKVGSSIDQEAYERGTSVYFPGHVIPMLPEKLSNNLCSLVPDKDRLSLTAILDFDKNGILKKKRFCRSTIINKNRFTYERVQELIDSPDMAEGKEISLLPMLKSAEELAKTLRAYRKNRGALGFTMPEAVVQLNDQNEIDDIGRMTPLFSRHLIEEFMLSANEAVAEYFTEKKIESLYRIHEKPNEEKLKEFQTYAHNLGMNLPPVEANPAWFSHVIEMAKGNDKEYVINSLLLRSMKQARYTSDNVGHFGLAAENYTHFTSPIRRYPDLMVHRQLCNAIAKDKIDKNRSAKKCGEFLSKRERTAMQAERDLNARLQCIFMEQFVGHSFEGIISSVSDIGFYIEFKKFPIGAYTPVEVLPKDIYLYDYRGHNLIAQNSNKFYSLGDNIVVEIIRIDRARNKIIVRPNKDSVIKN
ncbi:MAG: ribonuclease R [Desulfotalea sp.]